MLIRNCAATALLMAFALVGCGSEDDDGGGGDGGAAKTACEAYCDATMNCPLFGYMDVAECKAEECSNLEQAPAACATALKNHYDCVNAKADVCDETGCETDINACL